MPIDQDKITSHMKKMINSINDPVIVDVGAYTGHLALKLCKKLNNYKMYCIEACRKNFKILSNNTINNDKIFVYNLAISSYNGKAKFYVAKSESKNNVGSSQANSLYADFLKSKKWAKIKEKDISCITLDSFCEQNDIKKIDCLKINCEGCEFDIFDSYTKNFLNITKILYIEMHGKCDFFNSETFYGKKKKITNILKKNGFEMVCGDDDLNSKTHIRQLWSK